MYVLKYIYMYIHCHVCTLFMCWPGGGWWGPHVYWRQSQFFWGGLGAVPGQSGLWCESDSVLPLYPREVRTHRHVSHEVQKQKCTCCNVCVCMWLGMLFQGQAVNHLTVFMYYYMYIHHHLCMSSHFSSTIQNNGNIPSQYLGNPVTDYSHNQMVVCNKSLVHYHQQGIAQSVSDTKGVISLPMSMIHTAWHISPGLSCSYHYV